MKILISLEKSGISETIKNEAKERKWGFLSMLFGTLATIILGNALLGQAFIQVFFSTAVFSQRLSFCTVC